MKVYHKEQQEVDVLVDVVCDVCHLSCKKLGLVEQGHFEANWGYGSELDGEIWKLDLCIDCCWRLDTWVGQLGGKIRKENSYDVSCVK